MQYKDVCCDASVHASMLYSLVLAPRMLWMNPIKGYSETEKALEYTNGIGIYSGLFRFNEGLILRTVVAIMYNGTEIT